MIQKINLKDINRIAIPAIFGGIVEPIISLTDTVVSGHLDDAEISIGAVGLVSAFISTLLWVLAQSKSAISAFVAKAVGRGNPITTNPLFFQLFVFNGIVSIFIAILSFHFSKEIFEIQNTKGVVLDNAISFFEIRVFGFPLTLLTFTIFGLFRGLQNTLWAMQISILGAITNIFLDYYLGIYLNYGIEGIAYASLIAQLLMFILAIIFMFKKTQFRFTKIYPLHQDFYKLLVLNINLYARALTLNITFWFANYMANDLGNIYLSTHTLLVQIWLFSAFLLDGYADAANAISGKLLGEKSLNLLDSLRKQMLKIMLGISFGVALIFLIIYPFVGGWFTHNTKVIDTFKIYFWIILILQPINSIAFLYDGIFKGLGDGKSLRNNLFFSTFMGFFPALFVFKQFDFGLYGIWFSFIIWMLYRGIGLHILFNKKIIHKVF